MRSLKTIAVLVCLVFVWTGFSSEAFAKRKRRKRARRANNASLLTPSTYSTTPTYSPSYSAPATPVEPVEVEAEVSPILQPDHVVTVALALQGGLGYGPGAIGFAADYARLFSERWSVVVGAGIGLRQNRTLLESHVSAAVRILSLSEFDFGASAGLAVPLQLMSGTVAIAVAGRGSVSAQWRLLDWLEPHVGVVLVAGPLMTPGHLRGKAYVTMQAVVGTAFAF